MGQSTRTESTEEKQSIYTYAASKDDFFENYNIILIFPWKMNSGAMRIASTFRAVKKEPRSGDDCA